MNDQIKKEGPHTGGFLLSEGSGTISRATATVTGGAYLPGQVLGRISASNRYTALNPTATDGSQKATAILYGPVDASAADRAATLIVRQGEVIADALIWPDGMGEDQKNIAIDQLAQRMLLVR